MQDKKRPRLESYQESVVPIISPKPKILALRYEDAAAVNTAYVSWRFNLTQYLSSYTKARLLSAQLYNNYSTARLTQLGITIAEFNKSTYGGSFNSSQVATWVVPNQNYSTTAFTLCSFVTNEAFPDLELDNFQGNNLTVTLSDGIGSNLVASGSPAGFFCDLLIMFY